MSDTSTINLPENRISNYRNALGHANRCFSYVPLVQKNELGIICCLLQPVRNATDMIRAESQLMSNALNAEVLTELNGLLVRAMIDSSQALASETSSGSLPVANFRLSAHARNWHSFFVKLESLRTYKEGWNGYSAPAPEDAAIANARAFLAEMRNRSCIPTRVCASAVGGVAITRRQGEKKVYVEFFNGGKNCALFADDATQSMFTNPVGSDSAEYERLISEMKDYLGG